MEKKKVQIKICGATYSILTEDEAEYVEELGEFIDSEMKNISSSNPSLSSIQCAVLVALDRQIPAKKQLLRRIICVLKSRIILKTAQGLVWRLMLRAEKLKD